jgi:hypothetical protein
MAIDFSKLSDEELEAIANDDYSKLSEATLRMLSGESAPVTEAAPAAKAPTPSDTKPGFFSRRVQMRPDEYGERIGAGPEMGPSAKEVVDVTKSAGLGTIAGLPRMGAGITSIAGETDTSRALREMEERLRQRAPKKEVFEVAKYAPEVVPALGAAKAVSAIPMASRTAKQVSQAAGQAGVAAAVEPEERAEAAALAGGVGLIPTTIRGLGALREKFNEAMTGGPPDVVRDQIARIAEQLGFKIEAGQVSRATPVSTAGAGEAGLSNQERANRWASAPTGESTDKVTGTFLNERRGSLGKVYDDIFQKRQFNVTGDSLRTLENVLELEDSVSPAHVPAVKKLAQQILKNYDELVTNVQRTGTTTPSAPGGRQAYFFTVDGEGLQRLRNKLTTVASTATDKSSAREIYKMIDNLDQAVRDTDPKLYEKLMDTNTKYRATMTLKELQDAKGIDAGDVSLERLGNLVKGDDYNPLFPIGNIGEQLGIRAIWEPTVAGAARGATQQAATLVKPGMGRIIFNRLARYPSSQAARNLQKKIIDAEATGGLGSISFTPEEIAILNPIVRSIAEEEPEKKAGGGVVYTPAEQMLLKRYSTGGPTSRPTLPGDRSTGYKQEGDEENRLKRFLEAAATELPSAIKQSVTSNSDLAAKYLKFKFGMMSPDEAMMVARSLPETLKGAAVAAMQAVKEAPRAVSEATPESAGQFTAQMVAGELTDPTRLGRVGRGIQMQRITEPEREFANLYHGSPNPAFEKFDPNVKGEFTGRGALGPGHYVGEKGYAEGFAGRGIPEYEPPPNTSLTQWKPNIKKSLYFDDEGFTPNTPRANAANRKAFEAVKKVDPELAYRVFEFKGDRVVAIRHDRLVRDADGKPSLSQDDFIRAMDIAGIDSVVDLVPGKGIHQVMVRDPANLKRVD